MILALMALSWALPDKELKAGLDRRVLLIDESGRQIDCGLVEVQDEQLVVRLWDGSLATVVKDEVDAMVDLGPHGPEPAPEEPEEVEAPVEEEDASSEEFEETEADIEALLGIEPEDEAGSEEELEDELEIDDETGDELEIDDGSEARVELPEDELDLPESDAVAELQSEDETELGDEPAEEATEPEPAEEATVPQDEPKAEAVTEGAEAAEEDPFEDPPVEDQEPEAPAVASVDEVPAPVLPEQGPVNADLYYKGRAEGGSVGKKTRDVRMAQNLGFLGGCCAGPVGCTATTMIFALKQPEVPAGDWQDQDPLYQQGYVQAYQESAQREAAKRAFIAGTLGTASTALVATVLVLQVY